MHCKTFYGGNKLNKLERVGYIVKNLSPYLIFEIKAEYTSISVEWSRYRYINGRVGGSKPLLATNELAYFSPQYKVFKC
jgi:hypothetical protein